MRRGLLLAALLVAACTAPSAPPAPPERPVTLRPVDWPAAPFTPEARRHAVRRGVEALIGMGEDEAFFAENAGDLLWCLSSLHQTAADPEVSVAAGVAGRRLARRWLVERPALSPAASVDLASDQLLTLGTIEELGLSDATLRAELVARLARISPRRLVGFDPRRPPPLRVGYVDVDLFYDALITVYFGERMGVQLGGAFAQLLTWLPQLWPYPTAAQLGEERYWDLVYLVTHLVYTQNGYGARGLDPTAHAEELAFLRDALAPVLEDEDLETAAELVDTLRAFGAWPGDDPPLAEIVVALLGAQGEDGSWSRAGDTSYDRYHFTWTAIDALRDYRAGDR